jgi:Bacterial Ig domain
MIYKIIITHPHFTNKERKMKKCYIKKRYTFSNWLKAICAIGLVLCFSVVSAQTTPTVNITTHNPATTPAGWVFEWHSAVPVSSGNLMTVAQAQTAASGIYYAVWNYGGTPVCYSDPTPLKIVTNNCGYSTIDLKASVDSTTKPSGSIVTFHSGETPTDINRITATTVTPTNTPTTYFVAYKDASGCYSVAAVLITIGTNCLTPDVNVGLLNKPINGNVATNDKVLPGTTYGSPVLANSPAGSNPSMTMNSDGTYTFQADKPGVYTYNVPVCASGQSAPCPTVPLVITVTDPTVSNNSPVANTDIATAAYNTPVTVPILANDGPGNSGGTLGTPTITGGTNAGATATINAAGQLEYTPAPGFVGKDTIYYQVCETPGGLCSTASVIITVDPPSAVNSTVAADDYITTTGMATVTGNVKTNDSDPQGNSQIVTAQGSAGSPITIAGKGTYYINSDGTYSFTPIAGFTGTVDIPYTTCDTGNPQACASATLHVVVKSGNADLAPNLTVSPNIAVGTTAINVKVRVFELLNVPTSGTITVDVQAAASWTNNLTVGATQGIWTYTGLVAGKHRWTTNAVIAAKGFSDINFIATFDPNGGEGAYPFRAFIVANSGGELRGDNNTDSETLDYFNN